MNAVVYGTSVIAGVWDSNTDYTFYANQLVPIVFDMEVGGQPYYCKNIPTQGLAPHLDPTAWEIYSTDYIKLPSDIIDPTPRATIDYTQSINYPTNNVTLNVDSMVKYRLMQIVASSDDTQINIVNGQTFPNSANPFILKYAGHSVTFQKIANGRALIVSENYGQGNQSKGVALTDTDNSIGAQICLNPATNALTTINNAFKDTYLANAEIVVNARSLAHINNMIPTTDVFDGVTLTNGQTYIALGQGVETGITGNGLYKFIGIGVQSALYFPYFVPGKDFAGKQTRVLQSSIGTNAVYQCTTPSPAIIGTDVLTFELNNRDATIDNGRGTIADYTPETNSVQINCFAGAVTADNYNAAVSDGLRPQIESLKITTPTEAIKISLNTTQYPYSAIIKSYAFLTQDVDCVTNGGEWSTVAPRAEATITGKVITGMTNTGLFIFNNNFYALPAITKNSAFQMVDNTPIIINNQNNNVNITLPTFANAQDGYFYSIRLTGLTIKSVIVAGSGTIISNQFSNSQFTLFGLDASAILQYSASDFTYYIVGISQPSNNFSSHPITITNPYQMFSTIPILVTVSNANIILPIDNNTTGGAKYTISLSSSAINCTITAGFGTSMESGSPYILLGNGDSVSFLYNGIPNTYSTIA